MPVVASWGVSPGFEWRTASVNPGALLPVTNFGSADWYTGSLGVGGNITQTIRFEARGLYRRGTTPIVFQAFRQWEGEAALVVEFTPPFAFICSGAS